MIDWRDKYVVISLSELCELYEPIKALRYQLIDSVGIKTIISYVDELATSNGYKFQSFVFGPTSTFIICVKLKPKSNRTNHILSVNGHGLSLSINIQIILVIVAAITFWVLK